MSFKKKLKAVMRMVASVEKQFGEAMAHGMNLGATLANVERDPKAKKEMLNTMARAAAKKAEQFEDLEETDG